MVWYAQDMGTQDELKTKPSRRSVANYLRSIEDPLRRKDATAVCALMKGVTGQTPTMWGTSMVGFGIYRYRRANGQELEWFPVGFSARKHGLTVYVKPGCDAIDTYAAQLGPHTRGSSCLHIRRLALVDERQLRQLVAAACS